MAFSIKDEETDKAARKVAELMGESLTGAVRKTLLEKLEQLTNASDDARLLRKKRIEAFLANRKPLKYKGNKTLKQIRDELWGM